MAAITEISSLLSKFNKNALRKCSIADDKPDKDEQVQSEITTVEAEIKSENCDADVLIGAQSQSAAQFPPRQRKKSSNTNIVEYFSLLGPKEPTATLNLITSDQHLKKTNQDDEDATSQINSISKASTSSNSSTVQKRQIFVKNRKTSLPAILFKESLDEEEEEEKTENEIDKTSRKDSGIEPKKQDGEKWDGVAMKSEPKISTQSTSSATKDRSAELRIKAEQRTKTDVNSR